MAGRRLGQNSPERSLGADLRNEALNRDLALSRDLRSRASSPAPAFIAPKDSRRQSLWLTASSARLTRPHRRRILSPMRRYAAIPLCAAALAAAAVAGCSRADRLEARAGAVRDDRARALLRDAVWHHGSKYAWAEAGTLRAEVTWTEHRPLGDRTRREVWTVDPVTGHCRLETPAAGETIVRDGLGLRVKRGGKAVADALARARAAGRVRLATELLTLPVSLLGEGRKVVYAGTEVGPGSTRTWDRLMVVYGPRRGGRRGDRLVVALRQGGRRIDRALLRWSEPPFIGRPMRVDLDLWRPAGDLRISRRWRLTPADEAGEPTGPVRYTVRIEEITTGAPAP